MTGENTDLATKTPYVKKKNPATFPIGISAEMIKWTRSSLETIYSVLPGASPEKQESQKETSEFTGRSGLLSLVS